MSATIAHVHPEQTCDHILFPSMHADSGTSLSFRAQRCLCLSRTIVLVLCVYHTSRVFRTRLPGLSRFSLQAVSCSAARAYKCLASRTAKSCFALFCSATRISSSFRCFFLSSSAPSSSLCCNSSTRLLALLVSSRLRPQDKRQEKTGATSNAKAFLLSFHLNHMADMTRMT